MDLTKSQNCIRICINKRRKYDPVGLKNAMINGNLREYLELELKHAGLDDDSIIKALSEDEFVQSMQNLTLKQIHDAASTYTIDQFENMIDEHFFDPMYEREIGTELDSRMHERMKIIGLDFFGSKSIEVKRLLKFPKICTFCMGAASALFTITSFLKGSTLRAATQAWLTHDLLRLSMNCYHKTYMLKGVRAMKSRTGLGSLIYDAVSSAITGSQAKTAEFLQEINTDILLDGTYIASMRYWYMNNSHDGKKKD